MNETIISTLIVAISSIICQILINKNNREKRVKEDHEKEVARAAREAEKETRLEDRLSTIEKKLDQHNGYGQKFETVAAKFTEIASDLSSIKTCIEFLKES